MPERLFYADSMLLSFDAKVVDVRERSRDAGHAVWQMTLDRTAFYPTSGGQPHDVGTLTATAPSGTELQAAVIDVEEDSDGEIWHLTTKPLLPGTRVQGTIEGSRRLDHTEQHSGQHLLSAVFERELAAKTISFHLGEEVSTIDLAAAELSPEQLNLVERQANLLVREAHRVTPRMVAREEAEALLAKGLLRKLPERAGAMRIVEMEGVELNACGGTHVQNTAQIGAILLRATERARGAVRVSFCCGGRALQAAGADNALLNQCSALVSSSRRDLPAALERLRSEAKAGAKERAALRAELADYHAARLLVEDPVQNGRRLVRRLFSDRDPEYVKLLASRLIAAAPQTLVALASVPEKASGGEATLVFGRSQDVELDCARQIKEVLSAHGGRGGGTAALAQGVVPAPQAERALSELVAL